MGGSTLDRPLKGLKTSTIVRAIAIGVESVGADIHAHPGGPKGETIVLEPLQYCKYQ